MLQEVKPDVVSVCSPNRFHFEHVMAALEAGCHVMCEKPPANDAQNRRDQMCASPRARPDKVLAYDFHHRFALDTQLLRDAGDERRTGRNLRSPPRSAASLRCSRAGASLPIKRCRAEAA
ncbi:MAG: Gfo/Idh/MocA family protein [Enterobacter sp.]